MALEPPQRAVEAQFAAHHGHERRNQARGSRKPEVFAKPSHRPDRVTGLGGRGPRSARPAPRPTAFRPSLLTGPERERSHLLALLAKSDAAGRALLAKAALSPSTWPTRPWGGTRPPSPSRSRGERSGG